MKSGKCSIKQLIEKIRGSQGQTRRAEYSIEQPIEKIRGRHWQTRRGECSIEQPLELVKHREKSLNATGKNVLNLLPSVRNIDYNMMQHIKNVIKL